MTSKKNPQADLNNKSSFYFAIGLFLVLFISWRAIEYKNWDDDGYGYIALDVDADDDEEIPITEQIKTPPPPVEITLFPLKLITPRSPKVPVCFPL